MSTLPLTSSASRVLLWDAPQGSSQEHRLNGTGSLSWASGSSRPGFESRPCLPLTMRPSTCPHPESQGFAIYSPTPTPRKLCYRQEQQQRPPERKAPGDGDAVAADSHLPARPGQRKTLARSRGRAEKRMSGRTGRRQPGGGVQAEEPWPLAGASRTPPWNRRGCRGRAGNTGPDGLTSGPSCPRGPGTPRAPGLPW